MKKIFSIAWIAMRELFHDRAFYIVLCFAILSTGLSLLLGQLTYTQQEKLTFDFMLAAIELSMLLFSIFAGISLFQRELTLGSVSMVLSKPVYRFQFLLGKYLGQVFTQALTLASMGLMAYFYFLVFYQKNLALLLSQFLCLTFFQILVVTAITYFFSVMAGAMTAAITTISWYALGHFRETVSINANSKNLTWTILRPLVPDLEVFNMKELASYGLTIPGKEVFIAFIYALVCCAFYLGAASIIFKEKDIPT